MVEVTAQLESGQAVHHAGSLDFTSIVPQRSDMPTLRDLIAVLHRREGVDAVVVVGRDGLLIDGAGAPAQDPDALAAIVPPIVTAAIELGAASGTGALSTSVLEYERGAALLSAISPEAYLVVIVRPEANLPALSYEVRRHRTQIATLV